MVGWPTLVALGLDCVVDFSGYKPRDLRGILELLAKHGKPILYIFISSDSVYEVCVPRTKCSEPTVEEEAVRPSSPTARKKLKRQYVRPESNSQSIAQ